MAVISKKFEGLENEVPYFARVFPINADGYAQSELDGQVASAMPRASRLPHGYTEVEYIESTGTQYINTNVVSLNAERFVGRITPTALGTAVVIGIYQNLQWHPLGFSQEKTAYSYSGWLNANKNMAIGVEYEFETNFSNGNQSMKIDGEVVLSSSRTSTPPTIPYYLFAINNNGNPSTHSKAKLDFLQIYQNDVLIRDFVPCVSDTEGAGLFDLVESKFYKNAGSGAFVAGNEVQ